MKILQVCPGYFPSIGGVENHVRNISERLARNHSVEVFTCDPSGKLPALEEINGIMVHRFRSISPGNAYHFSPGMLRQLRKCEYDIVHGHNYHAFPFHFCRYANKKHFIVNPHYHGHGHTMFRELLIRFSRAFGKKTLLSAARIIAVSRYEKDLLIDHFRMPASKISIIPNGVNYQSHRAFQGIHREPKTILFVGRLERYKGTQHLISVLPLLSDDFRLRIVGDGSYRNQLLRLVQKLNLGSRVEFYWSLPDQELLKMYAGAGVLILISKYEASSLVIGEALASGTPCIVANVAGLAERVDNENCFAIEWPVAPPRLADLINKVTGKKAKNITLQDWDQVTDNILNVYNQVNHDSPSG